jgi:hypothetical protein
MDRAVPRSGPPVNGARGFKVVNMVYETLKMTPRSKWSRGAGTLSSKESEEHDDAGRMARMGILPADLKRKIRSLGYKKLGPLLCKIREGILWAQHRRIQYKRRTRANRTFDDMG